MSEGFFLLGGESGEATRAPVAFLRVVRNVVPTALVDRTRVEEVFVQMVNKFQDVALHRTGDGNIVDQTVRPGSHQGQCYYTSVSPCN